MKFLRRIHFYTRGIRFSLLILTIMMTVSMLAGIVVVGRIQYIRYHYDIIAGTTGDPNRLYYFMQNNFFLSSGENMEWIASLREDPAVEGVYPVYTVNPLTYTTEEGETNISIVLYDPALLELFPGLDLEFSDPGGVILASKLFYDVSIGDSFELRFFHPDRLESFTAIGRMQYPYHHMGFNGSATKTTVNDLFTSGDHLMMLGTQENLEKLETLASVFPSFNFIFSISADATAEETEALMNRVARTGVMVSLSDILAQSKLEMEEKYREDLPMPVFLMVVSTFSYFSTLILIFKKKELDLAVSHLCGSKRGQCGATVLGTFGLVSVIPAGLTTVLVALIPVMDWLSLVTMGECLVDGWCVGLIGGYFLVSLLIAGTAVWLQMKNHTPLTLLRGVET